MSTGRKKTLGQRFGLLTGFGLILGGATGWGWSLLQAPGHAEVEPVPTPQPPNLGTTVPDSVHAAVETVTEPVAKVTETIADTVEDALPKLAPHAAPEPEIDEPEIDEPAAVAAADEPAPEPEDAEPAAAAPAKPVAVPDAVKAIRAAAAAARERLETPTRALPDAAEAPSDTEVG